ncbi:protein kinase domain-containing protein, partial [Rubrivirga sp.]|uniref:protein kinase domain-containing protein n=1 Tax=Rubrivirga sp. TaxID=1885344 RepID=UPI003C721BA9
IARLISAGAEESGPAAGRPWLALELVEGVEILEAARDLALEDRVRLVVEVAAAVHHAHRRLVVHRDLKPSNILVASGEKGRTVKLLDFGIAKLLDPGADSHLTSLYEWRPMTRAYAAPEQVRGDDVTTATDVYGLGLVLFEVLTGTRPFDVEQGVRDLEGDILKTEAPRLSAVSNLEAGGVDARRLRGDLDVICGKALAKEPEARYASAEAFGADLERWIAGEPIEARPPSRSYRAGRFVKRHRVGVASVALAVTTAVAGVSYYTVQLAAERDRAELSASRAEKTAEFLESLFADPDPTGANPGERTASDLLEAGASRLRTDLEDEPAVLATMLGTIGRVERALGQYEDADVALSDAVDLFEQTGEDPRGHRNALLELANLRYRTDDYEASERYALAALRLDSLHAIEPSERLAILNTLALTYSETDRLENAATVLREVIERRRQLEGDDVAVDLASNLSNLGVTLLSLGKTDEAEPLFDESLALTIQSRGPDHPYVAFALTARSGVHEARRDFGLALEDMNRAIEIGEAAFGLEHPFLDHARGVRETLVARRDSAR